MTPILLAICDIVTEIFIVFVDRLSFKSGWSGWDQRRHDRRRCVCEASGLIYARISAFQTRCRSAWMVHVGERGGVFWEEVRSEREKWFVGFCQIIFHFKNQPPY